MSSNPLKTLWLLLWLVALTGPAAAQDAATKPAQPAKATKAVKAEPEAVPAPAPAPPPAENTIEGCQDSLDNDNDGHVDCADQDCQIYALCVQPPAPVQAAPVEVLPPPEPLPPIIIQESGHLCYDGLDNDENGKTDCYEIACQRTSYCRKMMYERPVPADKAPGLFMNIGFGVALPNYRLPTMETTWVGRYGNEYEVPFDPDMGIMIDYQVGYLFLKFLGAGVSFKSAFTFASNRSLYFQTDDDPDNYKYTGNKYYGNLSGFLRFQWPFRKVTPYLNMHVGYSTAQATWNVYDPLNDWEDIDDAEYYDDDSYLYGERTEIRSDRNRHFTFGLEPGVDFSIVERMFAVGLRVWLPVVANEDSSMDNLGVLINFNFTPMWREPLQLKPEYKKMD